MTIILTCILIAVVLPILAKAPLAFAQSKQEGGYDNRHPRAQQNALTGFGARAKAAHENSFEALILFTPGALAVIALGKAGPVVVYLCVTFVVARLAYLMCYWYNLDLIRSICWTIGFVCSLGLLGVALY